MAAGPVFAQRGFDRAPVREIAKRAEVNVAAISYYFGDKMGLYRAVIAAIRRQRESEFPLPVVGDLPPDEALYRLIRTLLSRMLSGDEKGWEAMLMMREMQQPTAALEDMVNEYFKPLYDALCRAIDDLLQRSGHTDPPSRGGRTAGDSKLADWRRHAMIPQLALGVVGECLHYRIGRPVIDQLISPDVRSRHYDAESLCRHITATTLAACGDQNAPEYRRQIEMRLDCVRSTDESNSTQERS